MLVATTDHSWAVDDFRRDVVKIAQPTFRRNPGLPPQNARSKIPICASAEFRRRLWPARKLPINMRPRTLRRHTLICTGSRSGAGGPLHLASHLDCWLNNVACGEMRIRLTASCGSKTRTLRSLPRDASEGG